MVLKALEDKDAILDVAAEEQVEEVFDENRPGPAGEADPLDSQRLDVGLELLD